MDNQTEVQRIFEQHGFETIYPERLDFQSARELFSQAEIIAGPTGAAFANLLLCPPGTTALIWSLTFIQRFPLFHQSRHRWDNTRSTSAAPQPLSKRHSNPDSRHLLIDFRVCLLNNIHNIVMRPPETNQSTYPAPEKATSQPLVSILIPAYKSRWFEPSLVSALSQDYPRIEVIVYDNCPTEDIRMICERSPAVRYWRNPNERLQNILDIVTASNGCHIKFLFDDDLLEPNCVSELVRAIAIEPSMLLALQTVG